MRRIVAPQRGQGVPELERQRDREPLRRRQVIGLTQPLFELGRPFSGRDLILLGGGLVLIAKATWEIYDKLEVAHEERAATATRSAFAFVIGQILVMDIVFSLDSVITAVGMVDELWVMSSSSSTRATGGNAPRSRFTAASSRTARRAG